MASPTASTLARTLTRTTLRPWLRRAALPLGLGLTTGLVAVHHQRPMHLDAISAPTAAVPQPARAGAGKRRDLLDAATIKELSGGSLSGITSRVFLFPCLFRGWGCWLTATRRGWDRVSYRALGERLFQDTGPVGGHRDGGYPGTYRPLSLSSTYPISPLRETNERKTRSLLYRLH